MARSPRKRHPACSAGLLRPVSPKQFHPLHDCQPPAPLLRVLVAAGRGGGRRVAAVVAESRLPARPVRLRCHPEGQRAHRGGRAAVCRLQVTDAGGISRPEQPDRAPRRRHLRRSHSRRGGADRAVNGRPRAAPGATLAGVGGGDRCGLCDGGRRLPAHDPRAQCARPPVPGRRDVVRGLRPGGAARDVALARACGGGAFCWRHQQA